MTITIPIVITPDIANWIISGPHGASSLTLLETAKGYPRGLFNGNGHHPFDSGDLWQCIQLLDDIPSLRYWLRTLSAVDKYWAVLVEHWDELEEMLRKEKGEGTKEQRTTNRMIELLYPLDDMPIVILGDRR